MPAFEADGVYIYFAHCPKAGGTSVEKHAIEHYGALDLCDYLWDRAWFNPEKRGWAVFDPPCSPQHLTWSDAQAVLPRRPDMIFTVVRDPVSRMVSEYLYQRYQRRTTRLGKLTRRLGFSTWLRVMCRAYAANPYIFDNHLRPQVAFFPQTETKVFHLEDGLTHPLSWLANQLGRDQTPIEPLHALKSNSARPTPFRQDLELIAEFHAADYARLRYAPPVGESALSDKFAALRTAGAFVLAPVMGLLYRRGWI